LINRKLKYGRRMLLMQGYRAPELGAGKLGMKPPTEFELIRAGGSRPPAKLPGDTDDNVKKA
jgi:hypothetical protein